MQYKHFSEFHSFLRTGSDVFLRIDTNGTILNWQQTAQGSQRFPGELSGGRLLDFVPQATVPLFLRSIDRAVSDRQIATVEYSLSDAEQEFFFEARFYPHTDRQIVTIIRDITERKNAERMLLRARTELELIVEERTSELAGALAALKRAEERYRSIFENAIEGIYQADPQRHIEHANPELARMFGYPSGREMVRVLHRQRGDFFAHQEQKKIFLQRLREQGDVQGFEYEAVRADGSSLWVSERARLIRSPEGVPQRIEGMVVDITGQREREKAEAKQKEAELASQAKSEFLAHISHEMRTPLHVISGVVDLMGRSRVPPEQQKYMAMLRTSVDLVSGLIEDLLEYSRIESGKIALENIAFSLEEMLEETLCLVAERFHAKGLEILLDIDLKLPHLIMGDPLRIRQILLNLLVNAVKFTERGEVILKASRTEHGMLCLSVQDTGIGIARDKQDSIFASFVQADSSTTRKYGGSGLGLAICKKLSTLMGGQISVQSEPGRGSCFNLDIPLVPSQGSTPGEGICQLDGMKVLVVAGNATLRKILAELLRHWGAEVCCAANGREFLQQSPAGFHLALVDASLPDMPGYDCVDRMWLRTPDSTPMTVLLSCTDDNGPANFDMKHPRIAGSISKPVRRAELRKLFATVLNPGVSVENDPDLISVRQLKILIVEDCEDNRMLLDFFLKKTNHLLEFAATGDDALRKVQQERFDFIFMDLQLPGMDGFTATRAIREYERTHGMDPVPIVAVTAVNCRGDEEQSLLAGCTTFLAKPVKQSEILEVLERCFPRGTCTPPGH